MFKEKFKLKMKDLHSRQYGKKEEKKKKKTKSQKRKKQLLKNIDTNKFLYKF